MTDLMVYAIGRCAAHGCPVTAIRVTTGPDYVATICKDPVCMTARFAAALRSVQKPNDFRDQMHVERCLGHCDTTAELRKQCRCLPSLCDKWVPLAADSIS